MSKRLADVLLENQEFVMPLVLAGAISELSTQLQGLRDLRGGEGNLDLAPDLSGQRQENEQSTERALQAAGFELVDVREALGVGPAWHALHFTLAGTAWEATAPPGDAVLGGSEVGESEYGTIRVLTWREVARTAAALDVLPPEAFAARIESDAMAESEIYAADTCESSDGREWLIAMYESLREYYGAAARRKDGMLLYVV